MATFKKELKQTVLTSQGYQKLKEELQFLSKFKMKQVLEKLTSALESERAVLGNTAYEQAFAEKELLEAKIRDLEEILSTAKVGTEVGFDYVVVGSTVTLEIEGGLETYTLVSSAEVDSTEGKISHESPLGSFLLGKKAGDEVVIEVPAGRLVYKLVKVS